MCGKPGTLRASRSEAVPAASPDWSGGYTSLFALQQEEEWDDGQLAAVAAQTRDIRGDDRPAAT